MSTGPHFVLSRYPPPWNQPSLELIPQLSGWSGGQVWQVRAGTREAALRCWPARFPVARIHAIHQLQELAHDRGCSFVPQIIPCLDRATTIAHESQTWELATWMPGRPANAMGATRAELIRTAKAIAFWHQSLSRNVVPQSVSVLTTNETMNAFRTGGKSPSPGIRRRISEWRRLVSIFDDRRSARLPPEFVTLTSRSRDVMQKHFGSIGALERWGDRPLEMVVSLPDLHREHVLFAKEIVTGIIDFGGVTVDTPAMELVRFASSFDGVETSLRANTRLLLESYREQKPLDSDVDALVLPLAISSAMIGMLHWWEWLTIDGKRFSNDQPAPVGRWEQLIRQLEVWPAEGIP